MPDDKCPICTGQEKTQNHLNRDAHILIYYDGMISETTVTQEFMIEADPKMAGQAIWNNVLRSFEDFRKQKRGQSQ